jgi:hypothetical protein
MCNVSAPLVTHTGCGHSSPDPTATLTTIPCADVEAGHKTACQTYSHRPEDVSGNNQRLVRTTVRSVPGLCSRCEGGEKNETTSGSVSVASVEVEDEDLVQVDETIWGPAVGAAVGVTGPAVSAAAEQEDKNEIIGSATSDVNKKEDNKDADDEDDEDDDVMIISPSRTTPLKRRRVVLFSSSSSSSEADEDETPTKKRRGSGGARMVDVVARFAAARARSGSGAVGGDHAAPGLSSVFAGGGGGVGGGFLSARVAWEEADEVEEE